MKKIVDILTKFDPEKPTFPPTELFNEGWILRIILDWFSNNNSVYSDLEFQTDAIWFSEALLPTPFKARYRGDNLAESHTNADGVIGQFTIGSKGKRDFELNPSATQFIVLEAKLFSKLSKGITNAPKYDQAARNVACMAETLKRAKINSSNLPKLGFLLLAPEEQISSKKFPEMNKKSIKMKVKERVDSYQGEKDDWYNQKFMPIIDSLIVKELSWESIIDDIIKWDEESGYEIKDFYTKCIDFNKPK